MKVGKTVWLLEENKAVPVKLLEFGKGTTAEVEYIDKPNKGKRKRILKSSLRPKPPAPTSIMTGTGGSRPPHPSSYK